MARIVVAEPVSEARELLELQVAALGHELVEAEADVVLLEPVSSVRWQDLLARSPRAKVILQTAEPQAEATARELGAVAVLLKPFGLRELRRALDRALAQQPTVAVA